MLVQLLYDTCMKHPNKIKVLLAMQEMTQVKFAKELGEKPATVSHWVMGRVMPHKSLKPKILAILGKPWARVLLEEEVWPE